MGADSPEPGRRTTRQRTAVAEALRRSEDFSTAQQVHEAVRKAGGSVGLTTVYRALASLAAAGDVDVLVGADGEARYRMCSDSHHHHLVCRRCGAAVEVSGAGVERWATQVAERHGFTEVTHTVELFGVCPSCAGGGHAGGDARARTADAN